MQYLRTPHPYSYGRTFIVFTLFLLLTAFHYWDCAKIMREPFKVRNLFADNSFGPYGDLAWAFLSGHVVLAQAPDPILARCINPYMPQTRWPDSPIFQDYSYYKQKLYIYFGPVPVLTISLPWYFITGGSLPMEPCITFIYAVMNQLFFFLLVRSLIVYYYYKTPLWLELTIYITYCLCNFIPYIEGRATMYEVAIAGGQAYVSAFFFFLFRAIRRRFNAGFWLALASISIGLGAGCRPTILFLYPIISFYWLYLNQSFLFNFHFFKTMLAVFLPASFFTIALGWYNYIRFESPLEFGHSYLLNTGDIYDKPKLIASYIPDGLWSYYIMPWAPIDTPPYIKMISDIHIPFCYIPERGRQEYTGLFPSSPIDFVAFYCPYFIYRYEKKAVKVFTTTVLAWTVLIALVISAFPAVVARYESEPQIPILFCVTLTLLARRHLGKIPLIQRLVLFALVTYSCLIGLAWAVTGENYWLPDLWNNYGHPFDS